MTLNSFSGAMGVSGDARSLALAVRRTIHAHHWQLRLAIVLANRYMNRIWKVVCI